MRKFLVWLKFLELGIMCGSCAPISAQLPWLTTPPAWGYYGVQCVSVRKVVCLTDATMTKQQCENIVIPAIEEINLAVDRELLRYVGSAPYEGEGAINRFALGIYVVMGSDKLKAHELGVTQVMGSNDKSTLFCIERVSTRFSTKLWGQPYAKAVALHELVHGLGGSHVEEGGAFGSVMLPEVNAPTWRDHLTQFDIDNLRRVYGTIR